MATTMSRIRARSRSLVGLISLGAIGFVGACSTGQQSPTEEGPGGQPGSQGSAVGGGFASASGTGSGFGGGCAGTTVKAEKIPLDLFVMLDQSTSMDYAAGSLTRWKAVTNAFIDFLNSPKTSGISVGIQYFALPSANEYGCPATCQTDADCNSAADCGPTSCFVPAAFDSGGIKYCLTSTNKDACIAASYAKADVPIAPLPGNATALIDSLTHHGPLTGTPTAPAMEGAIAFAKSWKISHPDHEVVHVFATDGDPSECVSNPGSPTPQDFASIAAIAGAGFSGSPSIRTFVIGVGDLTALDDYAASGGTSKAFHIDTDASAQQQFLAALEAIQGSATLPCTFAIPAPAMGMTLDFGEVNVEYAPSEGASPDPLHKVGSAADCGSSTDAWYYDNDAAPTQIILCDGTCRAVGATANTEGQIEIVLGCQTLLE